MILVVAEQRGGKLNRATWETVAAAQQIAGGSGSTADEIVVALPGSGIDSLARELAGTSAPDVKELVTIDSAALEFYTADGYTAALQQAIEHLSPTLVVFPILIRRETLRRCWRPEWAAR